MMTDRKVLETVSRAVAKQLANEGRLMEGGFFALKHVLLSKNATAAEIEQAKHIFMAGAQHIWSSMMTMMDEEDEPTRNDMRRMSLLDDEMKKFEEQMSVLMMNAAKGSS